MSEQSMVDEQTLIERLRDCAKVTFSAGLHGVEADCKEAAAKIEALERIVARHVRWRETAMGFLRQVIDGRGCEDEWPALADFIERSDSRMVESSSETPK